MIGLSLMITIEALLPRREHPFEVPSLRRREDPLTQSPYVLFDSTPLNLVPVTENVLGSVHQVGVVDGRRRSIRRHGVQLVPRFCPLSSSSLHRLRPPQVGMSILLRFMPRRAGRSVGGGPRGCSLVWR